MQFKHPEILWALFLLVIPVAIHLFQLRRFARTPFTNVAMLQKVVSDSRKSSSLKKWLLLFTRLLLLAALILAFAQPFTAPAQAQGERETVIYLDNSFSMQARSQGMSLLDRAVQELIKGLEQDSPLSLFTNDGTFGDVTLADIRNSLLDLAHTQEQLDISQINLKAQTLFSKSGDATKHLIVISDFQQSLGPFQLPWDSTIIVHYVPERPYHLDNISVDSVYLEEAPTGEQASLGVLLSGGEKDLALPVSLYSGEALIAKTSATFKGDGTAQMAFSIPAQQALDGRVAITDRGLGYDNNFYFSIDRPDRIKVLALVEGEGEYLDRLFAEDPFELKKYTLDQLDHSALVGQNTILIDQLGGLPDNLQLALQGFVGQGGNLILVPPVDLEVSSYNRLLASLGGGRFTERVDVESPLTEIVYGHPLFSDVFQGQVDNFQYPTVLQHYKFSSDLPKILGLEGGDAFLSGREGLYVFSAGLDPGNTNFKN